MGVGDKPLISVIVCTYNGAGRLPRALASVSNQDFRDYELIVVDDGSDLPVTLPVCGEKKVKLIRTDHRGIGAARSEALAAARGTFIAYCDDDDEWTSNHLGVLLQYLLDHRDVDLVYADSEWIVDGTPKGVLYSADYEGVHFSGSNCIFASDVMHRAGAAHAAGGFDSTLLAYEDWDLWLRMSHKHTLRHLPLTLGCRHWHDACVEAGNYWQECQRVYRAHQNRLTQLDLAAQDNLILSSTRAPFDRSTWQGDRKELIWQSLIGVGSGSFGFVSRQLLLALERCGVDITMATTKNQPPVGWNRFYKPLDNWGKIAFYHDSRRHPSVLGCCERVVAYSTWEDTLVPQEQVDEINKSATLLYVPCGQNVESFRNCGVHVPTKVLHHGVDSEQFRYLSRSRRQQFTFGSFGAFSPRKGMDVLVRAFVDEFSTQEPVRLLLRSTEDWPDCPTNDPRVTVVSGFVEHAALLRFLQELDVFVLPSRGEGFGLCGLEAMSTGLPLIATNWSGPADYLDPRDSFPLSYTFAPAVKDRGVQFKGSWAEPSYEHLRSLMRWSYEHPEETAEKGRLAAKRVHRDWTWGRVAQQISQDLDEIANQ